MGTGFVLRTDVGLSALLLTMMGQGAFRIKKICLRKI